MVKYLSISAFLGALCVCVLSEQGGFLQHRRTASRPKPSGGGASFPSGATHHWAFENNLNDSIGSFTLTDNGLDSYPAGKHGQCVKIAAGGGNSVFTATDLPWSSAFTVSCWMQSDLAANPINLISEAFDIYIEYAPPSSVNGAPGNGLELHGSGATANQWHVFVLVFDGGTGGKLSLDGGTYITGTVSSAAGNSGITFLGEATSTAFFDESTFWPRALTQQEATDLWNGGSGLFP